MPARHYYLQCPQLCLFQSCPQTQPHWGNTCTHISNYLTQRKAHAAKRRVTDEEYAMAATQVDTRPQHLPHESIQGYDAWPFNHGKPISTTAILDTGANSPMSSTETY